MRHFWLISLAIILTCSPVCAVEWGVLPLPKHALEAKAEDLVEAVEKVKALPAIINVNISGWHDFEATKGAYDFDGHLGMFNYATKQGLKPYLASASSIPLSAICQMTLWSWHGPIRR